MGRWAVLDSGLRGSLGVGRAADVLEAFSGQQTTWQEAGACPDPDTENLPCCKRVQGSQGQAGSCRAWAPCSLSRRG